MPQLARRACALLFTMALALAAAAVGTGSALARLDVVRFATVLSGSMEPGIPTGSVIAGTPLPSEEVRVGDVVMFVPPEPYTTPGRKPVVHRVIDVGDHDGVLEVSTQGDANSNPDAWTLDARRTTFYEYRAHSALLGDVLASAPALRLQFLWVVPVLLLMSHLLKRIWGAPSQPKHAAPATRHRFRIGVDRPVVAADCRPELPVGEGPLLVPVQRATAAVEVPAGC